MPNSADLHLSMLTRQELEEREEHALAPYAMKSRSTRGRQHPEPEDFSRTVYRRDRDRVIHTTAFRRLEYKTQVFVNHEGDYYRTRLTHTLEVAQIAVSVARLLRLNEDLVEVVALAHDMGHPPFGHAGEDALRALMQEHGGFDHNIQGLRIVDMLEARYPNFPGLNLTWEVRESINKHRAPYGYPDMQVALDPSRSPLLESQLVDIADEIAYDNHDLDDGLTSGIFSEEDLAPLLLWQQSQEEVERRGGQLTPEIRKYQIIRTMINRQVLDLAQTTLHKLSERAIRSVEDVRACAERLVGFSEPVQLTRTPLKRFLWSQMYHHPRVTRMAKQAEQILTELFRFYLEHPASLPNTTRSRIARGESAHRVICDYLAGMTDRYCLQQHQQLCQPASQV